MIRGRCPLCKKPFEIAALDDLPTFPFCSERCRLVDLGRWIDEGYAIPADKAPPESERPDDRDPSAAPPDMDAEDS